MKRLEENLPYFGLGSDAGIEALARLAAAGVEIGFDPEAMGGGNDPFADYFGKVEAAGADHANKFLQWADEQIQRGVKMAKIQGVDISISDYKSRLEEIRDRRFQLVAEADTSVSSSRRVSLGNEVKTTVARQQVEIQTKYEKRRAEALAELAPETIANKLMQLRKDTITSEKFVSMMSTAGAPALISEVAVYLMSDESDRKIGEVEDLSTFRSTYRLLGKKVGTIKGVPKLDVRELGLGIVPTGDIKDVPVGIGEIPIVIPEPESPGEKFVGVSIEVSQTRIPKYATEEYSGSGLLYPNKTGDEFWRTEDMKEFVVSVRAGNAGEKSIISVKSNAENGIEYSFSQPNEEELRKALVSILAGLEW